jgi:phosphoglycolate phosphatase-like HAD superfamily hydrolase
MRTAQEGPNAGSRYDTVVLDVDGTLVDSNYQHALAWTVAFRAVGLSTPSWQLHRAVGMGADKLVTHVAGRSVEHAVGDEVRRVHEEAYADLHHTVVPLPGAVGLISDLRSRGFKVALASSASRTDFERAIELVDDAAAADVVVTGADVKESKPATDLLDLAVSRCGGARAAVLGDSIWDVASATRRHLLAVMFLTGGFARAELLGAGADLVFETPVDLRKAINDTPLREAARPAGSSPR